MKANTNNKKPSARKKILPAAGMLAISATMLATSTYAWFTMSREVEVKNIKMTATVPEDIQISLGHLVDFTTANAGDAKVSDASTFTGLSGNQGILKKADGASNADDGNVMAPYNSNDAVSALDWASSADISEYYRLGKIIPASSIDGQNIYFTPDAAGVGKSLKAGARYYQAADITGAYKLNADGTAYASNGTGDSAKTTLHAINDVTEANDKWNDGVTAPSKEGAITDNKYATGTEWNATNDDGYFVDIPIWLRSSAQSELTLAVDAYVTTTQAKDNDDLYCAARAVILYNDTVDENGGYTTAPATGDTSNLLRIRQDNYIGNSIVDYMYTTNATGDAVNGTDGTYANAVEYTGTTYLKVAAGANNTYGPMTKAIVRVWLEGEDPNCWNTNAGQDFNITLKFTKDDLSATEGAYPGSAIVTTGRKAASESGSLLPGARVKMTSTTTVDGTAITDELEFEFNGEKWSLVVDGSFHKYEGHTYSYGSNNNIQTSDDIAKELLTQITTKAAADATINTPLAITVT